MIQKLKITRVFIVLLAALLCAVLAGCSDTEVRTTPPMTTPVLSSTVTVPPRMGTPDGIYLFSAVTEGDQDRYFFLLQDAEKINVVADGRVKLQIFDDLENSLYLKEFDVKAAQYVDYVIKPVSKVAGKMYEWRVPLADIKKGDSAFGWGRAVFTFTTSGGTKLSAEYNSTRIPVYSEKELVQMAEDDYLSKAVTSGEKIRRGDIEVTVVRSGWFHQYQVGVDRKEYFRVDLEVHNANGDSTAAFTPFGVVLVDAQGNRLEKTMAGSFNGATQVKAGATVKGTFLFDNVSKTLRSAVLTFESGWDLNFQYYLFQFTINLIP
jgi:hypothetical protein